VSRGLPPGFGGALDGLASLWHLLATYALRLWRRQTALGARHRRGLGADLWHQGRALLERISRLGRSRILTPIFVTQMLGDAAELEPPGRSALCLRGRD
jgi:hypothetical protein